MSGRNPPLCCTLTLIAMQGHQNRYMKATISLDTAQFCYSGSRAGWVSALAYRYKVHDYQSILFVKVNEIRYSTVVVHDDTSANCQLEGAK